jgi:hypothetical protein
MIVGRLHGLRQLDLRVASHEGLSDGLHMLSALSCLSSLRVTLEQRRVNLIDLGQLPSGLASLELRNLWLLWEAPHISELTGEQVAARARSQGLVPSVLCEEVGHTVVTCRGY